MKHSILVVDDDPIALMQTKLFLEDNGYDVQTADCGSKAVARIKENSNYSVVLLDFHMRGKNGPKTAEEILKINPDIYIVMFSMDNTGQTVRNSWQVGVVDFIDKGVELPQFLETIKVWCSKFAQTHQTVPRELDRSHNAQLISSIGLVGISDAMVEVVKRVSRYREGTEIVLLKGETGTGKERIARALHTGPKQTFFVVNCGKYRGNTALLESELFGHEKNSFTGAENEKMGLLEKAQSGTVFFDETHHLSLEAQVKLLRAIGEKKGVRVGGYAEYPIDCKFVFAVKPDFDQQKEEGRIAEDFFYRLQKYVISVPALRDRPEDIAPLVTFFTNAYYGKNPQEAPKQFLLRTVRYLEKFPWGGNVRELEFLVERLLKDSRDGSRGNKIRPEQLPKEFFEENLKLSKTNSEIESTTYAKLKEALEERERSHIVWVLRTSVSKTHAAKKLGVALSTLHGILKRLNLEFPSEKEKNDASLRLVQGSAK